MSAWDVVDHLRSLQVVTCMVAPGEPGAQATGDDCPPCARVDGDGTDADSVVW